MSDQKQLITEIMNEDAKDGLYQISEPNKMVKQQTAVEWLIREADRLKIFKNVSPISLSQLDKLIKQAKIMHREQIENAHCFGQLSAVRFNEGDKDSQSASDYYTQTYGE